MNAVDEQIRLYAKQLKISMLCEQLSVSKSAAIIRLRQLGRLEDRPYLEYYDPLEIWA